MADVTQRIRKFENMSHYLKIQESLPDGLAPAPPIERRRPVPPPPIDDPPNAPPRPPRGTGQRHTPLPIPPTTQSDSGEESGDDYVEPDKPLAPAPRPPALLPPPVPNTPRPGGRPAGPTARPPPPIPTDNSRPPQLPVSNRPPLPRPPDPSPSRASRPPVLPPPSRSITPIRPPPSRALPPTPSSYDDETYEIPDTDEQEEYEVPQEPYTAMPQEEYEAMPNPAHDDGEVYQEFEDELPPAVSSRMGRAPAPLPSQGVPPRPSRTSPPKPAGQGMFALSAGQLGNVRLKPSPPPITNKLPPVPPDDSRKPGFGTIVNRFNTTPKRPTLPIQPQRGSASSDEQDSGSGEFTPRRSSDGSRPLPPAPIQPMQVLNQHQWHDQLPMPSRVQNGNTSPNRTLPKPPLSQDDGLSTYPWYFADINREEAKNRLCTTSNGTFLVRRSLKGGDSNPYTLVIWFDNRPWNLLIRLRDDNKYAVGSAKEKEQAFLTVPELITFHKTTAILLAADRSGRRAGQTTLKSPPRK